MFGDLEMIKRQMNTFVRRRLLSDRGPRAPFPRRPDRSRRKAAAAVRADIVQSGLDAVGAEGAFIAADPSLQRSRRQVPVAIFAVRPKLQRHRGRFALGAGRMIADPTRVAKDEFSAMKDGLPLQRQF